MVQIHWKFGKIASYFCDASKGQKKTQVYHFSSTLCSTILNYGPTQKVSRNTPLQSAGG